MPTFSGRGEVHYELDTRVEVKFLADLVEGRRNRLLRLWALRRMYRRIRPDVVVSFLTDVNVASLIAGIATEVPIIVSERTYPPHISPPTGMITNFLRRILYKRAESIVVQPADTADWVRLECGPCRVSVIPNPVSLSEPATQRGSPAKDRKMILAVGRLVESKRFELLLQSFARISRDYLDWDVCILGDGPLREPLRQMAQELGLEGRIIFPGFSKTPEDWYSQAEIYVLTSSYEGMPNTLIEAMAYGIAPIAFDIRTGPRDILQGGTLGMLLPDDRHVDRLTEGLRNLITERHRRAVLGANARIVRETYAIPKILAAWDVVLREAVGCQRLPKK